jgi:molybdopterin/thiamine biosynthesis adenylyltransferase
VYKTKALKTTVLGEHDVFSRHTALPWWNQEKFHSMSVSSIGAGGLNGRFDQNMCRLGVGEIAICDGDRVELSNFPRQFFYPEQKFRNKAIALAENLCRECTDATTIIAYPLNFEDALYEYPDAFKNTNLMMCMTDNDESRRLVSAYSLNLTLRDMAFFRRRIVLPI